MSRTSMSGAVQPDRRDADSDYLGDLSAWVQLAGSDPRGMKDVRG
jgi:hypothetical protein